MTKLDIRTLKAIANERGWHITDEHYRSFRATRTKSIKTGHYYVETAAISQTGCQHIIDEVHGVRTIDTIVETGDGVEFATKLLTS